MKKSIYLILSVILLYSCNTGNNKENFNEFQIENLYKIKLPYYLKENKDDSSETVKVFGNSFREVHILIKHSKKELYDPEDTIPLAKTANSMLILLFLSENNDLKFNKEKERKFKPLTVNNLKAVQTEVTGISSGADIHILFTVIQGKDHFYNIQSWTHTKDTNKYTEDFNKIMNSFTEI